MRAIPSFRSLSFRQKVTALVAFGAGFGAGVGLTATTLHLLIAAQPGDRLNFLGALLGATITVLGSVFAVRFLENTKLSRERHDRRAVLRELLEEVLATVAAIRTPEGDERFTAHYLQQGAIDLLIHKIRVLQDTRRWIVPDTAAMARAFGYIGELRADAGWKQRSPQDPNGYVDLREELEPVSAMARAAIRQLER